MMDGYKASSAITWVSAILGGLCVVLLVLIVVQNRELFKSNAREANEGGEGGDDALYKKMQENADIDGESDIGITLLKRTMQPGGSTATDPHKASSKSLMI